MIIEVTGRAGFGATPLEYIADMLRYDNGEVLFNMEFDTHNYPGEFMAIIACTGYTEDRWTSFGLGSRVLFVNHRVSQ